MNTDKPPAGRLTDDEIVKAIRRLDAQHGTQVGRNLICDTFSIGSGRADRVARIARTGAHRQSAWPGPAPARRVEVDRDQMVATVLRFHGRDAAPSGSDLALAHGLADAIVMDLTRANLSVVDDGQGNGGSARHD